MQKPHQQDKYIRDIIDYSRNTRKQINITEVNLNTIGRLFQNQFTKIQMKIKITTDLEVEK
jgi:hypothetical protein